MNVQTSTETSKWVVSSVNSKQHSTLSCKVNTAKNRGMLKLQPFCPHTCKYYFGTFLTTAYVFYMQFTLSDALRGHQESFCFKHKDRYD